MPMDGKFKPRWSRIEKTFNDVLVAANGCLALVAVLLASLLFIKVQLVSWQAGDESGIAPANIEMRIKPS